MNKKGISLIVLVITIIVMIILAASVVITLSNSGIINKATTAVDVTNSKEVEQYAQLLWAEAYMEGNGKWTAEELQEYIDDELSEDIKSNYIIVATEKGIVISTPNVDTSEKELIKFIIINEVEEEYTAIKGMTWEEWINSEYNNSYFINASNQVEINNGDFLDAPISVTSLPINPNDVIQEGWKYKRGEIVFNP